MSFQSDSSGSERSVEQSTLTRIVLFGCAALLIGGIAFGLGSGVGYAFGRLSSNPASEPNPSTSGLSNDTNPGNGQRALEPEDMEIFWEAMELLERDFYGDLPTPTERNYGAIRGVLDLLDDPNTSFLTPEQATNFLESMDGSFEGIGATVEWDDDLEAVRIVEPFQNQPAWDAGIRRGDLVTAVDGEPVSDMGDLNVAISRIKGPRGSDVVLTILRQGEADTFDITVTRDVIQIPIVFSDVLGEDEDIAYIRLSRFSDNAGRRVRDALDEAIADDPRALIFDLRGNPGGLLREAVNVTSIFLEDEDVLIERLSDGTVKTYETEGSAAISGDFPIVVLVDESSASASEIVAGAIQDAGRAVLVGTTTFGKGSVQLPHSLSDGSLMRVTIARWYTPLDRSIDGSGLEPDIEVELTNEDLEADLDPQLDRAIELLESGQ